MFPTRALRFNACLVSHFFALSYPTKRRLKLSKTATKPTLIHAWLRSMQCQNPGSIRCSERCRGSGRCHGSGRFRGSAGSDDSGVTSVVTRTTADSGNGCDFVVKSVAEVQAANSLNFSTNSTRRQRSAPGRRFENLPTKRGATHQRPSTGGECQTCPSNLSSRIAQSHRSQL
jgi:hypothetical protein